VALAPVATSITDTPPPASLGSDADKSGTAPEDFAQALALSNTLQFPDAEKKNKWETLPSVSWTFNPNGLCPLPRVRLVRGGAYVEMSFNALTGDVEDESLYIP
jgi:hypothetical protein